MPVPPLTLLVITPLSGGEGPRLTPYSARGLDQTLEQIPNVHVRRDIMGNLMNLSYAQFQKYASTITCMDVTTPAFDGAWFGQVVEVECTAELGYLTASGTPQRSVVSGSSRTEGDFTYYRPLLIMMVVGLRNSFSEWRAAYRWQMDLQEI